MNNKYHIIAHRCNDLKKPAKALKQGVNALECDIWIDDDYSISHDGTNKQNLDEWLKLIGELKKKFENLSLLIFDIKKCAPIEGLIHKIHTFLPENINIIYSTSKLSEAEFFADAVPHLRSNEMLSIDEEKYPEKVKAFFRSIHCSRCCYGTGIDAKFPDKEEHHNSIKKAAELKRQGFFELVYAWTTEKKTTMRRFLDDGADGIMVNLNGLFIKPVKKANSIIQEHQHS